MRLPDEQEERGISMPVIGMIAVVSILILIILAGVLMSNSKKNSNRGNIQSAAAQPSETPEKVMEFAEGQQDIESLYRENKLRAEDLDFWDMYEDNAPEAVSEATPFESPTPEPSHEPTDEEKARDGKHVLVSYKDGTEEWLEISESIPLHSYDFTKMKITNGKMTYYEGNKKLSRLGVELSEENGDVDFEALKQSGIDFVMLRAGSRGYETGLIKQDEKFTDNIEAAVNAGLEVGVYFCSQAVSVAEAAEEAVFVQNLLLPYKITYPVAFRMDSIVNDTARTDILDEEQKTQIAEAFLHDMEREGYSVILYGSKEWLLTEILAEELLADRDVWLTEQTAIPEYPYQFKMWEYAGGESVSGVQGEVNYTISFVDYSKR